MSQRSTAQHYHTDTPFCTTRKSHVTWNFAVPVPHSEEIRRCILLFLCTLDATWLGCSSRAVFFFCSFFGCFLTKKEQRTARTSTRSRNWSAESKVYCRAGAVHYLNDAASSRKVFNGFRRAQFTQRNTNYQKNIFVDDRFRASGIQIFVYLFPINLNLFKTKLFFLWNQKIKLLII